MNILNQPQSDVAPFIAERLATELAKGKTVLWLLSGGSGGKVCVEASKLLAKNGIDTSKLLFTMSDERYGELDHADENVRILREGGLAIGDATFYRPLRGESKDTTTVAFCDWLTNAKQQADYTLVVLGVGSDGHTAGIKPHSTAVHSEHPAELFEGDDFSRLTVTPMYLQDFDEAIVQVYGETKVNMLRTLLRTDTTLDEQPAQLIKSLSHATLFTDFFE